MLRNLRNTINILGRVKSLFVTPSALQPTVTLRNSGFEADWGEESSHWCLVIPESGNPYQTEVGNIFSPPGWLPWFRHVPGTWDQPEVKDAWDWEDERRVHSGSKAIHLFTFSRNHDAGFLQQVSAEPGTRLRFSAWCQAWSNHNDPAVSPHPNDPFWSEGHPPVGYNVVQLSESDIPPLNGDPQNDAIGNIAFVVGIDPTGGINPLSNAVVWGDVTYSYNGHHLAPAVEAVAQADTVTVFLRSVTLWKFKHLDVYYDDALLEVVDEPPQPPTECRGTPRIQYERTYALLPPTADYEWIAAMAEVWQKGYRVTVGNSADDAGIGDLDVRRVIGINPFNWDGNLVGFFEEWYPGVLVYELDDCTVDNVAHKVIELLDWLSNGGAVDPIALSQCDPRWADDTFGAADCSLTYCQAGCYLTCLAMALRCYEMDTGATPVTVNNAIGPSGFTTCRPHWDAIESSIGLAVDDPSNVDDELAAGKCAMAEVQPTSLEHFVLVIAKAESGYQAYDPIDGSFIVLEEKYQGVESWRLLTLVEEQPPPVDPPPWAGKEIITLHVQQPTAVDGYGDLEFARDVSPAGFKTVGHMQALQRVKSVSPDTVTIYRQFVDNQGQYWDNPDQRQGAREFLYTFLDSLLELQDSVDFVQGLNEIGVPNELTRLANWECWFAEALAEEGMPARPCLLAIPVGNPKHPWEEGGRAQIEEMLPAVEKVIEYGGALGCNNYFRVEDKIVDPPWPDNLLHFAMRPFLSWDPVFNEYGLYPNYVITESGAFLNAVAGWKHGDVYDGDWPLYSQGLLRLRDEVDAWNAEHNWRAICYCLFTYKNPGDWQHYNLYGYARALAEVLTGGPVGYRHTYASDMDWYYEQADLEEEEKGNPFLEFIKRVFGRI